MDDARRQDFKSEFTSPVAGLAIEKVVQPPHDARVLSRKVRMWTFRLMQTGTRRRASNHGPIPSAWPTSALQLVGAAARASPLSSRAFRGQKARNEPVGKNRQP